MCDLGECIFCLRYFIKKMISSNFAQVPLQFLKLSVMSQCSFKCLKKRVHSLFWCLPKFNNVQILQVALVLILEKHILGTPSQISYSQQEGCCCFCVCSRPRVGHDNCKNLQHCHHIVQCGSQERREIPKHIPKSDTILLPLSIYKVIPILFFNIMTTVRI